VLSSGPHGQYKWISLLFTACLFPKLFSSQLNSIVLDEKAIKWIIREKEKGTPTNKMAEIEGIKAKSKRLQAVQGSGKDLY